MTLYLNQKQINFDATCFRHDFAIYLILTREWPKNLKLSCNLKFCSIQLLIHIQTFYKINWGESSTAKLAQQLEVCLQHVDRFCFQRWSFTCSLHDSSYWSICFQTADFPSTKAFYYWNTTLQFAIQPPIREPCGGQESENFNIQCKYKIEFRLCNQ